MSDPYKVLGVSPNATDDEIKTAYRELAKKYHPDNYAESPLADLASEKMKEINEAYDTIMNDRKARANKRRVSGRLPVGRFLWKKHRIQRCPQSADERENCGCGADFRWGSRRPQRRRMVFPEGNLLV